MSPGRRTLPFFSFQRFLLPSSARQAVGCRGLRAHFAWRPHSAGTAAADYLLAIFNHLLIARIDKPPHPPYPLHHNLCDLGPASPKKALAFSGPKIVSLLSLFSKGCYNAPVCQRARSLLTRSKKKQRQRTSPTDNLPRSPPQESCVGRWCQGFSTSALAAF